jgi:hypothetical protein
MYTALRNKNGFSCLTIIVNERQLETAYGGRNNKWNSLQADILKDYNE